jgi:hypothetical protein
MYEPIERDESVFGGDDRLTVQPAKSRLNGTVVNIVRVERAPIALDTPISPLFV